ncbi:sulfatase [Fulvivirgaceae bacterium BMA10]|uniref:Sulfatase n=1 Tax=Splendidivirga corallicola TaxID=3051826 RepID=A0ABT8KUX9_9BACT|nr:sulfatase [Fulvivirgaceae bacterium BMA10]
MNNCKLIKYTILAISIMISACGTNNKKEVPPNIVIIFTDDQGYADVGTYGARGFKTPHLDAMATEGMKFTDFYVASSVCSPSRAALLTGCYPQRIGIPGVLFPERLNTEWNPKQRNTKTGIHPDETTIAEMLKDKGYATGCFGKWHLGHHKQFLPLQQGFDEYFGLPYSNDMRPGKKKNKRSYPDLPLMNGNDVHRYMEDDQSMLTTEYTERAIDFIKRNKDNPFFVYLPHTMPHIPLYVSEKFDGHSEKGIYGDVIEEIDWSVGQINKTLQELGLEENTLVIFTCDNGPWLIFGDHGGSAYPLREGKFTTFEGGQRVPCLMKWPKVIPEGYVCSEIASTLDMLPTIAKITGSNLPSRKIDGYDITDLMLGKQDAKSPRDAFFYYRGWNLEAVRSGKWKLHLPHQYNQVIVSDEGNVHGRKGIKAEIELSLFDLSTDVGEQHNVADSNPEIVESLLAKIEAMKKELGSSEEEGTGKRDCGWQVSQPPPSPLQRGTFGGPQIFINEYI